MSTRIHSANVGRSSRSARRSIEALEPRVLMAANAWKAAVGGDWSDGTKWSAGHVPTSSEDVSIAVAGSYVVTHTAKHPRHQRAAQDQVAYAHSGASVPPISPRSP